MTSSNSTCRDLSMVPVAEQTIDMNISLCLNTDTIIALGDRISQDLNMASTHQHGPQWQNGSQTSTWLHAVIESTETPFSGNISHGPTPVLWIQTWPVVAVWNKDMFSEHLTSQ